jgi:hypothetical protein
VFRALPPVLLVVSDTPPRSGVRAHARKPDVVDPGLHCLEHGGAGHRRDRVDVGVEGACLAFKDDIPDARNLEQLEAEGVLVGCVPAADVEVDAIAIALVVFRVAAADDAVVVGDEQGSELGFGVVGEVVTGEDQAASSGPLPFC